MGFLKRLGTMNRLAKQMATLKVDHPEAWAFGETLADEALAERSDDLVRMIHERGEEGIEFYSQQVREAAVTGVASGEIPYEGDTSQQALVAIGIACGMRIHDRLEAESRGR